MIRKWNDNGWRRRFALLPIYLSDGPNKTMVWFQWVWKRDQGLYVEVSLTDPARTALAARGGRVVFDGRDG